MEGMMTYARVHMFTNISDSYKNNMMKRTVSYYIIALIFLGLFSCKSERLAPVIEAQERNDISDNTHVLDIAKYTIDTLSLDKLIYDVKYIELENQPEACMTVPMNVKIAKGIIYVSDLDENLFCFDSTGHFLRKAFKKGRGHGEVHRMYDYDVDDSLLYVLDGTTSAISTFSHDGLFVGKKEIPFRALGFSCENDNYFFQLAPYGLENKDNDDMIAVTDSAFNILYTSFKYDLERCNPVKRTPSFTKGSNLYAPIYGRSIYRMGKDSMDLAYYLKFDTPYYEPNKKYKGEKEAVDKNIYYTYDSPIVGEDILMQNFTTSTNCRGTLLLNLNDHRFFFVRHFLQDSPYVYNFLFSDTKFYNAASKEFVAIGETYYSGEHDDDIKRIKASLKESAAKCIIKESEVFSENPVLILYKLHADECKQRK